MHLVFAPTLYTHPLCTIKDRRLFSSRSEQKHSLDGCKFPFDIYVPDGAQFPTLLSEANEKIQVYTPTQPRCFFLLAADQCS